MRRLPYVLLALLLLAAAGVVLLADEHPTGHASVQAAAVNPATPWGGLHGKVDRYAAVKATAIRAEITKTAIYAPTTDCRQHALIASNDPLRPQDIKPVGPAAADKELNINPRSPFSVTRMYTQQATYELDGRELVLWSTQTTGKHGTHLQAVARAQDQIVFVTRVMHHENSSDSPRTYQLLVPAGEWIFTPAPASECPEHTSEPALHTAIPTQVCTNTKNTLYAASAAQHTTCRASDVPDRCSPAADVHARISTPQGVVLETRTGPTGAINFTPQQETTYTLSLAREGEHAATRFRTQNCLEHELPATNHPLVFSQPEQPSKTDAAYMLVILLTISTLLASAIVYAREHKNDNVYVLSARIAWERLKQLLR